MYVCKVPVVVRRGIRSPGTQVTYIFDFPWKLNTDPLEEEAVLLTIS